MKKIFITTFITIMMLSLSAYAQNTANTNTASSAVGIGVGGGAASDLTVNSSPTPAGLGRLFPFPYQAPNAQLPNLFLPSKEGINILDNARGLPMKITRQQANNALVGGVKAREHILVPVKYEMEECELLLELPAKANIRGYVFLNGDEEATTIDLLMKAYLIAMDRGATKIVILKKQASAKIKASGTSIGIGGGVSALRGSEKDNALTVGGGLGVAWGYAEQKFRDGMAIMMFE